MAIPYHLISAQTDFSANLDIRDYKKDSVWPKKNIVKIFEEKPLLSGEVLKIHRHPPNTEGSHVVQFDAIDRNRQYTFLLIESTINEVTRRFVQKQGLHDTRADLNFSRSKQVRCAIVRGDEPSCLKLY